MGDESLTYGELETLSNRLANLLRDGRSRRGNRVCLFLPKSPLAITSMLAVLKADGAYVPIDIASPAPRVARIVEAAEPSVVLVARDAVALVDELVAGGVLGADVHIGTIEDEELRGESFASSFARPDWDAFDDTRPASENRPEDLAHILFTSGSTGVPKGVMITHSNVLHFVDWATEYFGTKAGDRISGHPPLHFDLSTFDVFATLGSGATLHLVPALLNLLPPKLADFIRDAELTQWFAVPSAMTHMASFGVVTPGAFPSLERVIWCGEVLPTPVLMTWMDAVPQATFTNLYGPTEATIASSFYRVLERPRSETESIPIGVACDGEELLVLDEGLQPVPPGEIGDLFIAGVGLSPGYWRDEEKTRAAFLPDPRSPESGARIYRTGDLATVGEDGLVSFLGRADSQIKSRGYRIELGEIETALNAFDDVGECAVVGFEAGGFEGTAIGCAYSRSPDADVEPAELRRRLREVLPSYMLPSEWLVLESLPKNVNGKIDRRELRERLEEQSAATRQAAGRAAPAREARAG